MLQKRQAFANSGIGHRVVEHVTAVVTQKIGQAGLDLFMRHVFQPQCALDEHGCAASDHSENLFVRQRRAAHLFQRGVDRERQVEFRIDQSAVEIEDQGADGGKSIVLVRHSP